MLLSDQSLQPILKKKKKKQIFYILEKSYTPLMGLITHLKQKEGKTMIITTTIIILKDGIQIHSFNP